VSCGNPHEVDCAQVHARLYEFLDNEADEATCAMMRQHLAECWPCNQTYGVEQSVKALVARACGCEPVPDDLRRRVSMTISQVEVQIQAEPGAPVTGIQMQSVEWTTTQSFDGPAFDGPGPNAPR
jgi:mycothiol system anti-sigma-R factor